MSWNYRIVSYPDAAGYGLHEVYYDPDGTPTGMTAQPAGFVGSTPEELLQALDTARSDALQRPVLPQLPEAPPALDLSAVPPELRGLAWEAAPPDMQVPCDDTILLALVDMDLPGTEPEDAEGLQIGWVGYSDEYTMRVIATPTIGTWCLGGNCYVDGKWTYAQRRVVAFVRLTGFPKRAAE